MDLHNLLQKPVITEKSMQAAGKNKFTFVVAKNATKNMVKRAVEQTYNVKVKSVATSVIKGKTQRVGTRRSEVKLAPYKKAIVELEQGQKIDLFDLGA